LKEISNIFYGTIELASLTDEKECYRGLSQILNDAREQGLPEDWLPICEDNGSYYCLSLIIKLDIGQQMDIAMSSGKI
jgi:hypothetical protein